MPQRLRVFQSFHRVQRFARLRNGDDQLLGVGNHIAVTVFAGDFHIGGDFGDAFQPVFAGGCGVKRGAAGKNFDAVNVLQNLLGGCAEIARDKAAFKEHFGGVGNGAGLLVDFFLHKVAIRPQLQRCQRQLGRFHAAVCGCACFVHQFFNAVFAQQGNVAVFQIADFARERNHGGNIGGDKGFALAQGNQQRAAHAGDHHVLRVVLRDDGDGIRAVEVFAGSLNGGKQITPIVLVFVVNGVGNDFGVGLRFKRVAQALQAVALGFKVFNDAVVHHGDCAARNMRMGVGLGYAAVGCPARMPDADVAKQCFFFGGLFHQGNAPHSAHAFDFAFAEHGDT